MADNNTNPGLTDLISLIFKIDMASKLVKIPAEVKTYDPLLQTCDAEALVKIPIGFKLQEMPIFRSIPVQWDSGDDWSIVGNMKKGDIVTLTGSSADIQDWMVVGAVLSDDASTATALPSFIAEPGLRPFSVPLTADRFSSSGLVIYAKSSMFLGDSGAIERVVLEGPMLEAINKWITNIFNTHTHPTPSGPSSPPTTPDLTGIVDRVGATKVYAI